MCYRATPGHSRPRSSVLELQAASKQEAFVVVADGVDYKYEVEQLAPATGRGFVVRGEIVVLVLVGQV